MKRYLSIVLGDNCKISKTLIEDESYQLDKYIYDNFKDSESIRMRFKKEIEKFFNENSNLISSIEMRNHKKYNGQIVILQVDEDGNLIRIKVVYKKETDRVKELLNNQDFMKKFITYNRHYFSDFIYHQTRRKQYDSFYKRIMNQFYSKLKTSESFFDFCRSILKFAELENKINSNNKDKITNEGYADFNLIDEELDKYEPDREFHPDLDDIARGKYNSNEEFFEAHGEESIKELKPKSKVKVIKRDPNQLSFFD